MQDNSKVTQKEYVHCRHFRIEFELSKALLTNALNTVADDIANDAILDMQEITDAISRYYYRNGEILDGIFVVPEYQERFEKLAREASDYYDD